MPTDTLKPLNGGDMSWVCEPNCTVGTPIEMPTEPMVQIIDAEMELVCIVPVSKAQYMVRLLNTYETVNDDAE
jgi:hypothetical protein